MSHRPGSTFRLHSGTWTRLEEWWQPEGPNITTGLTDEQVNALGFEVSPPPSVPNVVEETPEELRHYSHKAVFVPLEWGVNEVIAVLKSAVVKELKWASPVQKGDVPALCVEVYSRNFVRDKQYRILVIEPSPSPLDGAKC